MADHQDPWLVRGSTIRMLWIMYGIVLVGLVALDAVVTPHPHFGLDGTFGFSAWYGFVSCVVLVAVAKALGLLLKRPDNYYGD